MRPGGRLRVLALYPAVRGGAYVLMDRERRLLDHGRYVTRGKDKNAVALRMISRLVDRYEPTRVAIEDVHAKGSRRSTRVRLLHDAVTRYARGKRVRVRAFSRSTVYAYFGVETAHELSRVVAGALPALAPRLPPVRKPWMSLDARQSLFDAAALALITVGTIEGNPQKAG